MADATVVRFHLFGEFRAIRNGQRVKLPTSSAGTYLQVLLLSGEDCFDSTPERHLDDPGSIQEKVLRANKPPKPGQGGYYDFTNETGLALEYAAGFGICLAGDWTSDVRDFEEIWKDRDNVSTDQLQHAWDMSKEEVQLDKWDKGPVLSGCWKWAKNRVKELQQHRIDIGEELIQRKQQSSEVIGPTGSEAAEESSDVVNQLNQKEGMTSDETSGPAEPKNEPTEQPSDSAFLRDVMREFGADPGSSEDTEWIAPDSPSNATGMTPNNRRRQTAVAVGVAVVAVAALLVLWVVSMFAPSWISNQSPGSDGSSAPTDNDNPDRGLGSGSGATDEREYVHRAPGTAVDLETLFLKTLSYSGAAGSNTDVVIGRQIFSRYIRSQGSEGEEVVPAYKLEGQFETLTCVLGVPDEDARYFTQDARSVLFEGDGRVLKRVAVEAGTPLPVTISVRGIRVVVISFTFPVVIADAKVLR